MSTQCPRPERIGKVAGVKTSETAVWKRSFVCAGNTAVGAESRAAGPAETRALPRRRLVGTAGL